MICQQNKVINQLIIETDCSMSELDQQTLKWLRSLKLSRELKSIRDFHNGYYFGEILSKMGLATKQAFHNKNDLSCIFQNYKEVRDVLSEKLSIDLPTDNLIAKGREILCLLQEYQASGVTGKAGTSSIKNNTTTMHRSLGNSHTQPLPRKIIVIQQKLQKFKDQHMRQQQFIRQQTKKDTAYMQLVIQQRVKEDREKMKLVHTLARDQDKRVMEFWNKTQKVKMQRIERDNNLNDFLRCKRENQLKRQREQESKGFREGLQAFEENCIKLGIDIDKDPERVTQGSGKEFNKGTFLERIADKTAKDELARKDKVKRLNNLNIMQKSTAGKAEKMYEEQNLVEKYARMASTGSQGVKNSHIERKREEYANSKKVEEIEVAKKKEINIVFDQERERQRQDEYRVKRIEYMEINLARKEMKRERHGEDMQDIVNKFINMACECYDYGKNVEGVGEEGEINGKFWGELAMKFIENVPSRLDRTLKDGSKSMTRSKFIKPVVAEDFHEYISMANGWVNVDSPNETLLYTTVSSEIVQLIDLVYPPHSAQPKELLSSYMPLKLCLFGSTLSGRHTQALKLSQKYGVNIIDLNDIIKEALTLASPPAQEKKGAKKDSKKGEEEKPERIRLRQFGVKLKEKIKSPEEADVDTLLEVFVFKIKQLFPNKTMEEITQEFKEAEQRAVTQHTQAMKEYQDALKKQKKDPKKPVTNEPDNAPKINPNPFTKGFVVVGFPDNLERFVEFEKSISGFITQQERVNEKSTNNRVSASQIVYIQDRKEITTLEQSYLDHVIEINTSKERLDQRNEGRKVDPNTGISYHPKLNPCVPEIKGLVDQPPTEIVVRDEEGLKIEKYYQQRGYEAPKMKTFVRVNGNEPVMETFKEVEAVVETLLNYKTAVLKKRIYGDDGGENVERPVVEGNPGEEKEQTAGKNEGEQPRNPLEQLENISQIVESSPSVPEHKLELNETLSNFLLKKFNEICETYSNDISSHLLKLNEFKTNLQQQFYSFQEDIIQVILSPDDKNIKILSYQDSYNKLLSEKEGLVEIEEAKQHLLEKLDKLYDSLWESIKNKKDEAVQKRKSFLQSSWLFDHSQLLLESLQSILQVELNKATQLILFSISLSLAQKGENMLEASQSLILECFVDGKAVPAVFHKEDMNTFPQLEAIIDTFKDLVATLPQWVEQLITSNQIKVEALGLSTKIQDLTSEAFSKLILVSNHLYNHISLRLREYRIYYQLLLNRMDDWIIYGIKKENDTAYGQIKEIKKAIHQAKKSSLTQSPGMEINSIYKPYSNLPEYNIPIPQSDGIISPDQCRLVVEELISIADFGRIPMSLFKEYVDRRIKSNLFPQNLMVISMDSLHQYLVQEDSISLEQIAISIVMLGYNIPSQEQIEQLLLDSGVKEQQEEISFQAFFRLPTFLDQYDYRRILFIKYMLSHIFGGIGKFINIKSLYNTLITLNRIGAESFSQLILESR